MAAKGASAPFEYKCTLKEETLALSKNELNEDPETRMLELKAFRDRALQYKGLFPRTDPQFLIRFLRARKFDQERAFQLLLNFYTLQKDHADIFVGLKPSNVVHIYRERISMPWPHRDRMGRKVYIFKLGKIDPNKYNIEDMVKQEFINISRMIEDEETQVRGFTILSDYTGYSMSTFMWAQVNIKVTKIFMKLWQDSFPARMKASLIVNEPHWMDAVMAFFTPFLKEKLVKRIHRIGTDWQKLYEFIAPEHLPEEYGGTLKDLPDPKAWEDEVVSCDSQFQQDGKFGFVDYTIGHEVNRKQQDAITNMAGTFKKLNVD